MITYYCDWDDDSYDGDDGFGEEEEEEETYGDQEEEEEFEQEESSDDDEEPEGEEEEGYDSAGDDEDAFVPEISADATEEDFAEDTGNWTEDDYAASASRLFGGHEYFGETIDDQLADAGYQRFDDPGFANAFENIAPGASETVRLYEQDGRLHAFGFVPAAMAMLLRQQYSGIVFDNMFVTVPPKGVLPDPQPLPPEYAAVEQKPAIDLRPACTPVGDQADTSRCSAFAWTHAVELTRNLDGKPCPRLSPSYAMLEFQRMQGDAKDYTYAHEGGSGTVGGPDPGEVLQQSGTCRQELWPDDAETPKAGERTLAADAEQFRLEAKPHPIALDDVKTVLSAGSPVHVGMNTGPGFAAVGRDGVISAAEPPSGQHGRHAMLIVGYQGNYYTVKNSWGSQWGDQGYCYIPKNVLAAAEPDLVAVLRPKQEKA